MPKITLLLLTVCLFTGCGDAGVDLTTQGRIPASGEAPDSRDERVVLRSPVVDAGKMIPGRFRCEEEEVWLPLEIMKVPERTVELVLVASRSEFRRRRDGSRDAVLISLNFLGGLRPDMSRLQVGARPAGSFWKRHYSGFCPDRAGVSGFVFVVYAMGSRRADGLKKIVYLYSSEVDEIEQSAIASGSLAVLYRNDAARGE